MKRALISVSDKSGLEELAGILYKNGIEILSTGGTAAYLRERNIPVIPVDSVTGFPEILDGRVKTLHPLIHGGLLFLRDKPEHVRTLEEQGITPIDLVVVNLYPFLEKAGGTEEKSLSEQEMIEFIDIGGPSMLRSAAKSFRDVAVFCRPQDYSILIESLEKKEEIGYAERRRLASRVFGLTSVYDAAVSRFLSDERFPDVLPLSYGKSQDLRYGENPHQKAAFYVQSDRGGALKDFRQLQGKQLSYNNIRDMDSAWRVIREFPSAGQEEHDGHDESRETVCCGMKHMTPCAVARGASPAEAWKKVYEADPVSIFGGIVSFNAPVDAETAALLKALFLEVILAPAYSPEALGILQKKKNLRVIEIPPGSSATSECVESVSVDGGLLLQEKDQSFSTDFKVVTEAKPDEATLRELIFAQKVVKHARSNGIVTVKNGTARGIGSGQVNRIWAAEEALERGGEGCVLASDAFFPFGDVVEKAALHKVRAIIQPGGSIRDEESVEACNRHGIPMVFSGMRHFRH